MDSSEENIKSAGEAATGVVAELKRAEAEGAVCTRVELQELAAIARMPGAKDVAEIVSAQYPLAK